MHAVGDQTDTGETLRYRPGKNTQPFNYPTDRYSLELHQTISQEAFRPLFILGWDSSVDYTTLYMMPHRYQTHTVSTV